MDIYQILYNVFFELKILLFMKEVKIPSKVLLTKDVLSVHLYNDLMNTVISYLPFGCDLCDQEPLHDIVTIKREEFYVKFIRENDHFNYTLELDTDEGIVIYNGTIYKSDYISWYGSKCECYKKRVDEVFLQCKGYI